MKLSRALRSDNGLPVVFAVDTLQNAVRQSGCGVVRSLQVLSTRIGTIKASGVTLRLREGLRLSSWLQYLTTRLTFAKCIKLSCRWVATTKRAPNWSARWDSRWKVASRTQGQRVILRSGQCAEMTVNI